MLERILPAGVAVAETTTDLPVETLWPGEEAAIAAASESRRREYATGRHCARGALARLGIADGPVLRDPSGCPVWPDGVVGSLTHCPGYRAAAVARRGDLVSLGIDAEPAQQLHPGVLARISSPAERSAVARLASDDPGTCWDRLLFSAKESIYKAWFPLTRRGLDFHQAEVELAPDGSFSVSFTLPLPDPVDHLSWQARWVLEDGFLATAVWVGTADTRASG